MENGVQQQQAEPVKIPPTVAARLRELSAFATGAEGAAKAAIQVASERREAFESELGTVLGMLGLDPSLNWSINFARCEITPRTITSFMELQAPVST
jgi:hypothetical protein